MARREASGKKRIGFRGIVNIIAAFVIVASSVFPLATANAAPGDPAGPVTNAQIAQVSDGNGGWRATYAWSYTFGADTDTRPYLFYEFASVDNGSTWHALNHPNTAPYVISGTTNGETRSYTRTLGTYTGGGALQVTIYPAGGGSSGRNWNVGEDIQIAIIPLTEHQVTEGTKIFAGAMPTYSEISSLGNSTIRTATLEPEDVVENMADPVTSAAISQGLYGSNGEWIYSLAWNAPQSPAYYASRYDLFISFDGGTTWYFVESRNNGVPANSIPNYEYIGAIGYYNGYDGMRFNYFNNAEATQQTAIEPGDDVSIAVMPVRGYQTSGVSKYFDGSYPTYAEAQALGAQITIRSGTFEIPEELDPNAPVPPLTNLQIAQTLSNVTATWNPATGPNATSMYYYVFIREQGASTWNLTKTARWNDANPTTAQVGTGSNGSQTFVIYNTANQGTQHAFEDDQVYELAVVPETYMQNYNKTYSTMLPAYGDLENSGQALTTFTYGDLGQGGGEEEPEEPGEENPGNENPNNPGGGGNENPTVEWTTLSNNLPGQTLNLTNGDRTILNGTRGGVAVGNGAILKGTGTTHSLGVSAGGIIAPGLSPGTLTVLTNVNLAGQYQAEIQNSTLYDQLRVGEDYSGGGNAVVIQAGATLNTLLYTGWSFSAGDQLRIIDNRSETAVTGTFQGLAEGEEFVVSENSSAVAFTISYVGGDGNDVVLTAVNTAAAVGVPNTGLLRLVTQNPWTVTFLGIGSALVLLYAANHTKRTATTKR